MSAAHFKAGNEVTSQVMKTGLFHCWAISLGTHSPTHPPTSPSQIMR